MQAAKPLQIKPSKAPVTPRELAIAVAEFYQALLDHGIDKRLAEQLAFAYVATGGN